VKQLPQMHILFRSFKASPLIHHTMLTTVQYNFTSVLHFHQLNTHAQCIH